MKHTITCKRCGKHQEVPKEGREQPDMPMGWSVMTIAERGGVVENLRLCGWCTLHIRKEATS